jgi:hypothetical protein
MLDVLPQMVNGAPATDPVRHEPDRRRLAGWQWRIRSGTFGRRRKDETPLSLLTAPPRSAQCLPVRVASKFGRRSMAGCGRAASL